MNMFQNGEDIQMGFKKDQTDQNEFFLLIQSTKTKESLRIIVDDIDEIEHVQGTLKFYIHYQKKVQQSLIEGIMSPSKARRGFKNLLKKKMNGSGSQSVSIDPRDED